MAFAQRKEARLPHCHHDGAARFLNVRTGCLLAAQSGFVMTLRRKGLPIRRPPATGLLGHYPDRTLTGKPIAAWQDTLSLLAQASPNRRLHGAGDAAYHGKALLVEHTTITTRLPVNAALYAPAPPHTGRRGRPRLKGNRLGHPADLAANADWRPVTLTRYGHTDTVEIALCDAIWYGAFGNTEGRAVLVRDPAGDRVLAIFTTDTDSDAETIVGRYTHRWPIETAIAAGKQLLGIGQARNRLRRAVERTVPLGFCVYILVIVWYALHGYHRDQGSGVVDLRVCDLA